MTPGRKSFSIAYDREEKATKVQALVATVLCINELTEYLYQ
jgi:hypothetical protein